jgi:tetrahydromethanopterin S-methyltransferase subunit G
MEAMRQSWSDDRLDHLNDRVDTGFALVDQRFDQVDQRFEQIDQRFDRIETEAREFRSEMLHRLDKLEDRLYALHRTLVQAFGALIGTVIVASAGIIASLN